MSQLRLSFESTRRYDPKQFLLHGGVREIYSAALSIINSEEFQLGWITAAARSGKTHLAVSLHEDLVRSGKYPTLIPGSRLAEEISHIIDKKLYSNDPILVDDADHYFSKFEKGQNSGEFVNLIENLRARRTSILFFSSRMIDELKVDAHVLSRLRAGVPLKIGDPEDSEIESLLTKLALQRGIKLDSRKLSYLAKRTERSIASLETCVEKVDYLAQALGRPLKVSVLSGSIE